MGTKPRNLLETCRLFCNSTANRHARQALACAPSMEFGTNVPDRLARLRARPLANGVRLGNITGHGELLGHG